MKVCHISSFYPPIIFGGAEIYVRRVAERMAKDSDVVVITIGDKIGDTKVERLNGVKVYRVHPLNVYPIPKTRSKPLPLRLLWNVVDSVNIHSYHVVRRILEVEKPDLVHIHHFKGFTFSFKAVKDLNLPLVYTAHNYYIGCPLEHLFSHTRLTVCENRRLVCKLYGKLNRARCKPDIVTAPTNFVLRMLKTMEFFKDVPMFKVPLGIEVRRNFEVKRGNELLFVGRITPFKGLDVLLKAIKGLNVRLNVVGSGDVATKMNNVKFHGFVSEDRLVKLYRRSSVLIIPSIWYEVFGLVIVEAFNFGMPVIGSNIGGIPELIVNGYNGYLFKPGDHDDLRDKILRILEEKRLRRFSINAYRSAKKYDINKHVKKLYNIYSRIS